MITRKQYLTANGQYPERELDRALTPDLLDNCGTLLSAVNFLLTELGVEKATVTSGFRPSTVNIHLANASKKSLHQFCLAIDLADDKDQTLGNSIATRPDLLRKYGLFIEDLNSTRGKNTNWVHLDISPTRPDRPTRMFKP